MSADVQVILGGGTAHEEINNPFDSCIYPVVGCSRRLLY
jgi:hypothetical protein